jgi:adenylate cyclase
MTVNLPPVKTMRVVLVCDVVESVRWMEYDEDYAISRWNQFVMTVRNRIADGQEGCVVKSTGDGLMVEFDSAQTACASASFMHKAAAEGNHGQNREREMHLRIGIHQAEVHRDAHDLYGHGVNLAARVTQLAGPGETIITPEVRDYLTDSVDGRIEDLGDCYLKHVSEPQRVYRLGNVGKKPLLSKLDDYDHSLKPTLAIIPFESRSGLQQEKLLGDLLADGVISRLVRSNSLRVLSRFSTLALRNQRYAENDLRRLLGADFVLRGSIVALNNRLIVDFELVSTRDDVVLKADRRTGDVADLFENESESCGSIATAVMDSIIDEQLKSSLTKPLPTLASYSLYLIGVAGIHRSMPRENEAGETALRQLIDRHPRAAEPAVWLAQWLAIKANRGLTQDRATAFKQVRDLIGRALDLEPNNSFGLAVSGLTDAFFNSDFSKAETKYDAALDLNPNDGLAWLYKSILMAWTDRGSEGAIAARKALDLSPLHPMRYYIESLAALPFLVNGDYQSAIELCQSSLRVNKTHTSTYRLLACGLVLNGQEIEAKKVIQSLRSYEPNLSVQSFRENYPGKESVFKRVYADALSAAGLK